jgi:hypothetical protein
VRSHPELRTRTGWLDDGARVHSGRILRTDGAGPAVYELLTWVVNALGRVPKLRYTVVYLLEKLRVRTYEFWKEPTWLSICQY